MGQWALGYRKPLNPNERSKRDNDGLLVKQRIIDIYQHTSFDGIDPVTCAAGSAGMASTPNEGRDTFGLQCRNQPMRGAREPPAAK